MADLIDRQEAIDVLDAYQVMVENGEENPYSWARLRMSELPSAQPDGIPLEWIDKHLEWLDNCDNDFAQLAKVSIKAMVELWKKDVSMCDGYRCDKCGFFVPWDYQHKSIDFINDYHFCPSCGADMRGGDSNE